MAKINRQHRRILHAVWPKLMMGPVNSAMSEGRYLCRSGIYGDGLTPKEREFVYKRIQELERISADLGKIYFRLKY